jgi:hypothetical protein
MVAVHRLSAIRVACAFRTVSEDAICVISGMLPIDILAAERHRLNQCRAKEPATMKRIRDEERKTSLAQWQACWDSTPKGRWTHRLIPRIENWVNRGHGEVDYYLTQLLSGHGCFRDYLFKFKWEETPDCPHCHGVPEDAEHVFFQCPRFDEARGRLQVVPNETLTPEGLGRRMLASVEGWNAVSIFATVVLKELRRMEQDRMKGHPNP